MSNKLKFSVITATMGNIGDRFCSDGYKDDIKLEEKLFNISKINEISGVELVYNIDGDESDPVRVKALLDKYGLVPSVVNAPLSMDRKWQSGTLSASNETTRKKAIALVKETMNFAKETGSDMVNLWMGQDGFDYSFQTDYTSQWNNMVESIRECADYDPDIKLLLEFKQREPRNRCLLDSASTTILLINETDRKNVGMTVDTGHVLQNSHNMAQVCEIADNHGLLWNLHTNDNYGSWDSDMVTGSVRLIEYLEFFYVIRKINYDAWISVDIFPFRENAFEAAKESILYMKKFDNFIDRIGIKKINTLISDRNITEVFKTVRENVFL